MKKIIINADDFGGHRLINRAVEEAVNFGYLRSATLMANGSAFDDAIEVIKRTPSLGVGIHFALVNGKPISPPETVPSLVDTSGNFYDNYIIFLKRYLQGKIDLSEIRIELGAQLEKIKRAGLKLTHFDSHQHLHHVPGITGVALELAKSAGIRALRIANAKIFDGEVNNFGQFIGRLGLSFLANITSLQASRRGFISPEHFAGIVAGEAVNEGYINELIDNLEGGTTEVMIHVGTNNNILQNYFQWEHDFEAELRAVTSPLILQKLREKNIAAESFAELIK